MSKRPTIALACIAKNEEPNVRRYLNSFMPHVDAVFFTDTGSTDKTVEIAKEMGATVSHFDWIQDFAAARNFSFSQVPEEYDFILWADLDDVLDNPQAFELFKQEVMGIADYHMAPYHYAQDSNGNPVCTFIRERVFRNSKKMKWRYFVHEGVTPISSFGDVRTNVSNTWAIKHLRTEEDLKKDRSRNLDLFSTRLDSLDSRMTYYYGKELFENGQAERAIPELLKAIGRGDLEFHDRILAMQYLGFAYMQKDRFVEAINAVNTGLQLSPTRAEYHCIIGDCYLKLGNMAGALPYYNAARVCQTGVPHGAASPLFYHHASYGEYPTCQISRIYGHMGDMDRAIEEARRAVITYKSKEAEALLEELKRMIALGRGYETATDCEDIVITTPPVNAYEWDPEKAKIKAMGGSETAAIEMAIQLKNLSGRPIKVFNMRQKRGVFDGVEYIPATELPQYMSEHKPFLHIAWRHNIKVTNARTYVWSHDLQTPGVENTSHYEKVLCLTPFHKRFMMATQGIPEDKIYVTRNGIIPERFTNTENYTKDPNKFIFSSSPDRGLDRTMLVLDKVHDELPDIKLHVFYGIEHLPKWGHQKLHDHLKAMMDERKDWVIYHGATHQDKLMEEFKTASYCVQPSDFIETSMISARERLYCGIYQIIRAVGGAVDTLADAAASGMATLVDSECQTEAEYLTYVEATKKAMKEEAYKRIKTDPSDWSWRGVAEQWLKDLTPKSEKKVIEPIPELEWIEKIHASTVGITQSKNDVGLPEAQLGVN